MPDGRTNLSGAAPRIVIVVRRTLDWADAKAVEAGLRPDLRAKVATWDETFRMPYRQFRLRLKEIAFRNFARVEGCPVVPFDAVPPGALAVPVDDDDWFAPDLAARLSAEVEPWPRGYRWTPFILEAQRIRGRWDRFWGRWFGPVPGEAPIVFTCESNNHAVVHAHGWGALVEGHTFASRHFDAHPKDVKSLATRLSVQNKNLASMSVLDMGKPTIEEAWLRRRHERFRTFYRRVRLPSDLAWAEPYVASMADLMDDLRFA